MRVGSVPAVNSHYVNLCKILKLKNVYWLVDIGLLGIRNQVPICLLGTL